MVRKLFLTPPALPEDTQCRGLVIPASKEWLGIFSDALSKTVYSYNYEQVNPTDLTPEETAARAWEIYIAWLDAQCGSACVQPSGSKVYRINSTTGHFEYLQDEEWVEDTAIPPAPPREEATSEERICMAARNAVEVLRLTWVEARAQWDANVSAQDAQVDTAVQVAAIIGALFYPPLTAIMELAQVGWEIVYATYSLLTSFSWDEKFSELLTCIFVEAATDEGGVVKFSLQTINQKLVAAGFSSEAYLLMVGQVIYFLSFIGSDGITTAGSLGIVPEGLCGCGDWVRVWEHAAMHEGEEWARYRGVINAAHDVQNNATAAPNNFAAIQCTITVPLNTHISEIWVWPYQPSGTGTGQLAVTIHDPTWMNANPSVVPPVADRLVLEYSTAGFSPAFRKYVVDYTGTGVPEIFTVSLRSGSTAAYIAAIEFLGEGPCPFVTGTIP